MAPNKRQNTRKSFMLCRIILKNKNQKNFCHKFIRQNKPLPADVGVEADDIVSQDDPDGYLDESDRDLQDPWGKGVSPWRVEEEVPLLVEDG